MRTKLAVRLALLAAASVTSLALAAPLPEGPLPGVKTAKLTQQAPEYVVQAGENGGVWDLSGRAALQVKVRNPGSSPVLVRLKAGNAGAKGLQDNASTAAEILPGETQTVTLRLIRRPQDPGYQTLKPFFMYFKAMNVRDNTVDPAEVATFTAALDNPKADDLLEVLEVTAIGAGTPAGGAFLPFVDPYGQYVHSDWPGKIYSDEDFAKAKAAEDKERQTWPGPSDWNQYGGYAKGPTLEKTGFFYVKKYEGKWWLVDPEGKLFWSYGPTGVGFGGDVSPFTERENWFVSLPPETEPFKQFYDNGRGATYMYYEKRDWRGFDMQGANLYRKYGPNFKDAVADVSHQRLRSWGFNTMGNWSAPEIYLQHKTPYTVPIHPGGVQIHYRMEDIYHPDWENRLNRAMERQAKTTANDPWNIGYFVDNERWWGWRPRAACIGEETLKNPPERHAKVEMIKMLKGKYTDIAKLNEAWGTSHASWDALAEHREVPDMKNAKVLEDCGDFGMMFAEKYFKACRAAVKKVAPNNMYLGPRFHGHVDPAVVALCAKYADLISYNIYDNPPNGRVNQYRALDVPIMSTEWGIGSDPAQTPFRDEKLTAPTPTQRANEMARYAEVAIRHPNMVGAHFFQFRDQPLSGRPDGEATLRGFVNIADTPNFSLVQANRRVAYDLYKVRLEAK